MNKDELKTAAEHAENIRRAISYIGALYNIGDVISLDLHLSGHVLLNGGIVQLADHLNLPIEIEPRVNEFGEIDGAFTIFKIDDAEILQFEDFVESGDRGGDSV